jgi:hypothetical protein
MGVVGIYPMAVDNSWQYRPQESPANGHIEDSAGDEVGTLRRVLRTSLFFRGLLTDQAPLKAPWTRL